MDVARISFPARAGSSLHKTLPSQLPNHRTPLRKHNALYGLAFIQKLSHKELWMRSAKLRYLNCAFYEGCCTSPSIINGIIMTYPLISWLWLPRISCVVASFDTFFSLTNIPYYLSLLCFLFQTQKCAVMKAKDQSFFETMPAPAR